MTAGWCSSPCGAIGGTRTRRTIPYRRKRESCLTRSGSMAIDPERVKQLSRFLRYGIVRRVLVPPIAPHGDEHQPAVIGPLGGRPLGQPLANRLDRLRPK